MTEGPYSVSIQEDGATSPATIGTTPPAPIVLPGSVSGSQRPDLSIISPGDDGS